MESVSMPRGAALALEAALFHECGEAGTGYKLGFRRLVEAGDVLAAGRDALAGGDVPAALALAIAGK